MKKLLSVVLAAVLLISLTVPVWATGFIENFGRRYGSKDEAIIIIPGLGGTSLASLYEDFFGQIVWYDDSLYWLAECNDDGTSRHDVYPVIASSEDGAHQVYYDLYDRLDRTFSNQYDVLFFSYDWRMSNADSANELKEWIDGFGYQNVILVAHSMGGLVASSLLCDPVYRAKVEKLITIGTPYLGAPAILYALETGKFFPEALDVYESDVKYLFDNFPAVYETLPICRDFQPYVKVNGSLLANYTNTKSFLETRPWARSSGTVKPMLADAINFHYSLMSGNTHITEQPGPQVYRIYGVGQFTATYVEYDSNGNYDGTVLINCGDGTVPSVSATNNSTLPSDKAFNLSHNDLVTNCCVIQHIIQCIEGTATWSVNNVPETNDRGWLIGTDNKRITVIVDGPDYFLDLLNSIVIHTGSGQPVTRDKNKFYVEQEDGTREEVGLVTQAGNEAVMFFMKNGDFSFTINAETDSIDVEYSDSGYYERVLTYSTPDASSATVTVSDYDSKEVHCVQTVIMDGVEHTTEADAPYELPEDELYYYHWFE